MKNTTFNKFSFLKTTVALVTAAVCALPILAQQALALSPLAPLRIQDGKLLDSYGKPFIFRGVTIDHTLAPEKTLQALKDISAAGANSAQIEFNLIPKTFTEWPPKSVGELREIIAACKENKLICVLEPNDVAGWPVYGGENGGVIASWWPTLMTSILAGNQDHIIVGFGNQHFVDQSFPREFEGRMLTYLGDLFAGLPPGYIVMIDGDNWSEDTTKSAFNFATELKSYANAFDNRIIYSVDVFSSYQNPEKVRDYVASFNALGAPLVIGGFGPVPYYHPNHPIPTQADAPQLPAASVMQYAQQYGTGYFGWSWSGNKNSNLDVVTNYDTSAITSWGNLLFNDVNGIKATAKRASIYDSISSNSSSSSVSFSSVFSSSSSTGTSSSSSKYSSSSRVSYSSTSSRSSSPNTSSSSSSLPFIQGRCTYHIQSEWKDGFSATIRLKNASSLPMNGWDVKWQYPDSSKVTNLWNANLSGTNPYSAKNLGWNATIQPGQTIEFGFQGKKPAGPAVTPAFIGTVCVPTFIQ